MKSNKSGVTVTYEFDKWFDAPNRNDNGVVKVIRCKDCRHYGNGYFAGCPVRNVKSPNDFCAWAERKEEK